MKLKFTASGTFEVVGLKQGKRSALIVAREDSKVMPGEFVKIAVGAVTILPNFSLPSVGELVEVEYLYAYKGGSLFQAVYKGPRPDQDKPDEYSSLKFKAENTDEDEG